MNMRKILLTAILCCIFCVPLLKAQTDQGKMLIGISTNLSVYGSSTDIMSMGYSSSKIKSDASGYDEPDPDKTLNFNTVPRVGFFPVDNVAVGLDFGIYYTKTRLEGDADVWSSDRIFSVGPFVRYYVPMEEMVIPFFEVAGAYGLGKERREAPGYKYEMKGRLINFQVGVGAAIPLGDNVTFDAMAGYMYSNGKETKSNPDNYREVIGTLGIKLGFVVFLDVQ